jgi:fibronectin type 3 domain-containing protein
VADLQATVAGEGVRLTWTLPRIRVDRSPLRELRRAELYRRLETGAETEAPRPAVVTFGGLFGPPPGVPGFERVANIVLAEPAPAEVRGGQVVYTDAQGLGFGQRYTYVVVAVDEQGRPSAPSNRVLVALLAPPRAPGAPVAQAGDGQVRLTWEAPATLEDGQAAPATLYYDVYRATGSGAPGERPVNPEPLAARQFVDLAVQNDVTYRYTVRALLAPAGPASRPSEPATATPEDTTAPERPRGLVAVVAGATVRLAWEAVADADLAGYHVYRSTSPGRGHARLTAAPQTATTYVDATARPGETYYYVVTAVDRARRANESVPSAEASARRP